jgi:hypothetical protein
MVSLTDVVERTTHKTLAEAGTKVALAQAEKAKSLRPVHASGLAQALTMTVWSRPCQALPRHPIGPVRVRVLGAVLKTQDPGSWPGPRPKTLGLGHPQDPRPWVVLNAQDPRPHPFSHLSDVGRRACIHECSRTKITTVSRNRVLMKKRAINRGSVL